MEPDDGESAGIEVATVRHVLDWDLSRVEPADGGAVEITNDLGLTFRVTSGYLVTYSVALVPCPTEVALLERVHDFLIPSAFAGHGGETDPSALSVPHVEWLSDLSRAELETVTFHATRYCNAHYLVARSTGSVTGAGVESVDVALSVEGSVIGMGGDDPFRWTTTLADGVIVPLSVDDDAGPDAREVTVTTVRRLGPLFDGIDPGSQSSAQIERALLTNLTDHVQVHIAFGA